MPDSTSHEPEWKTRRERIDPMLTLQGWTIAPFHPSTPLDSLRHHAVTEFETENGPADFALFVEGKLLGIVDPGGWTAANPRTKRNRPSCGSPLQACRPHRSQSQRGNRPSGESDAGDSRQSVSRGTGADRGGTGPTRGQRLRTGGGVVGADQG